MPIWVAILFFLLGGGVCLFLGISFQNKAFCNVFLMYSLIKCSIFTIYASNLLESIKTLYKFNNLVAYFCQHHWLQYSLGIFWSIATLTGIFLGGMPKIVGILGGLKIKVGSEPV